jgi:hypothetical protein
MLLAEQRGDLRAMIAPMSNGLDQDQDGGNIITLSLIGKLKHVIGMALLGYRDQSLTALTRSLAQVVKAWKAIRLLQGKRRTLSREAPHIDFLASENMEKRLAYTAKSSLSLRIKLRIVEIGTRVEDTQVCPEMIPEKISRSCGHSYRFLLRASAEQLHENGLLQEAGLPL